MRNLKKRVYNLLLPGKKNDIGSWIVEGFIVAMILLNIVSLMLETIAPLHAKYKNEFRLFDVFSVIVFSIEYVLRVWTITEDPHFSHPVKGRLKYVTSFLALCDLLSIIPFWLPSQHFDLRSLRLFRLLRIMKMARYLTALGTIKKVVVDKKAELFVSLVLLFFVLIIASSIMYYVEGQAQPDKFSSIPATLWWGISTLTTVGYGDVYPITPLGKFLSGIITLTGIGLAAVPTGLLASGFSEHMLRKKKPKLCPHCGKEIDEHH